MMVQIGLAPRVVRIIVVKSTASTSSPSTPSLLVRWSMRLILRCPIDVITLCILLSDGRGVVLLLFGFWIVDLNHQFLIGVAGLTLDCACFVKDGASTK